MKLTIFLGGLSGGGTERVVCNLANYLTEKGHVVEIITMAEEDSTYGLSKAVEIKPLLKRTERRNAVYNFLIRLSRLKEYMNSSDTDEYLVMLPTTVILLLFLRRHTNAPIIVSERADPSRIHIVKRFLLKRLAKYASGYVFQTEDAGKWYAKYIKGIRTVVIPNAINKEFIGRRRNNSETSKRIVAVGRFTEQKNFKLLIESFSEIYKEYPDYRLVLYGEGPQKDELQDLAHRLGISEAVEMPGYVSDIQEKISNATMFVLSSNYEGIPNSLMEAMALGLPCIATDCPVGGPRLLIDNGKNGLLVRTGDKGELVASIRKLLSNHELSETIGNNAVQITERLHPDIIYREWEQFLLSIIHDRSKV